MANPNNAVGTNGAFGGRTSVNAFNDVLATFTGRGVIQGWAVTPSTGLKVNVGGQSGIRDVAIAEDNNGNRTTIDNISQAPIEITMPSAPSTGSRIDLIVGYVENPPQGSSTVIDNPAPTGIITVSGSSSSSPSAPTDSAIRTALTNAGINGATAYYAVLGSITISSGTTDIDMTMISKTPFVGINTDNNVLDGSIKMNKMDWAGLGCIPTTFRFSYEGNLSTSVRTNAGTDLALYLTQGGVRCQSGGDKIVATETHSAAIALGGYFNKNIMINGVAGNSTVYTKMLTVSSGTTGAYITSIGASAWYGEVIKLDSNNKTSMTLDYRQIKLPDNYGGGPNRWMMDGTFVSGGANGYGSFAMEYQQGIGNGYYTSSISPTGNQTSSTTNMIYTIYEKID